MGNRVLRKKVLAVNVHLLPTIAEAVRTRELGRTGMRVSEVGFGAWAIGGNAHGNSYGPTDDAESIRAVKRAFDLGCTFFDSADVYGWGHSEEVLGISLEGHRDDVRIATKVGGDFYHGGVRMNFDPGYIAFALDRSLRRLRTDRVDLYQLHNPPIDVMGDPATYEALELLRREGKVVHYGVSIHQPVEAQVVAETGKAASIQLPLSIFRQEWIADVLPEAAARGLGVVAREPLANGFLTTAMRPDRAFPRGDIRNPWPRSMVTARVGAVGRIGALVVRDGQTLPQAAIRFVLAFPEVSVVIPGAKTVGQVEENIAAVEGRLTADELRKLRDLYAHDFAL